MGLFDWLTRRRKASVPAPAPAEPPAPASEPDLEGQWRTGVEADTVWSIDPDGTRRAAPIDALAAIAIETSDYGPDGRGAWWLFYGLDEDIAFTLPLGARGEGGMVEHLAALPGFRHHTYAAAVRSPEVDTFVIWQRQLD
ncbi:hypothetical protein P6144_02650 [Sphingomonas sp. HITSZ_GF]|uniref:hypothetical protein n=1 Tax=Sphingomonas sp. HITSZ_GF TaxID=3037247 RepID=UPI00240DA953|nr:hypothetical protein [Sphingomonas sp. HITSZ_GF]MDG2532534.1 hypothetical protein [Sphingomonas sp. HITSZ_GF]